MKRFDIANQKELAPLCRAIIDALNKGRFVICDVKSKSSKSLEQLGYYHGVILPRVQAKFKEDGNTYSLAQLNDFFNDLFFYKEETIAGRIIKIARSKSGATKDEMAEFINKVLIWCGEQGIEIPEPNTFEIGV